MQTRHWRSHQRDRAHRRLLTHRSNRAASPDRALAPRRVAHRRMVWREAQILRCRRDSSTGSCSGSPWAKRRVSERRVSPSRTRVIFRSFVADPTLLGQGAGGALDPVEMEDEAVVQSVQQGIRSRLYTQGRYAPRHEAGVHHFHRLLCAALQGN